MPPRARDGAVPAPYHQGLSDPVNEQVVGIPAPQLRPWVSTYVGYCMTGLAGGVHAGLPSRTITVVISLDEPVDLCRMPDPHQQPDRFQSLVGGLHAAPAGIRHDGNQFGIQLELTPAGSRALFGMPAAELARTVRPLDAVGGPAARSLPDRLRDHDSWTDRFRVLDRVLTGWLRAPPGPRDEVAHAWAVLDRADGLVDVGSIAAEVGWSRRHLGQQFRQEFAEARPRILDAVLEALSRAIAIRPSIQLEELLRMADFALWGAAIAEAIGYSAD
jgi:hypothetical protein